MISNLKILILDDVQSDAELMDRELKRSGLAFESRIVNNRADYEGSLAAFHPDIILSDHSLPAFNSLEALEILRRNKMNIPFILVTATVSEEFAVNIMKEGAFDYVLKDRMQRLPNAVVKAMEKVRSDCERQAYLDKIVASEALFTKAESVAAFGTWRADLKAGTIRWSAGNYPLLGYTYCEVEPSFENFLKNIHPCDARNIANILGPWAHSSRPGQVDFTVTNKDGSKRHIQTRYEPELNERGEPAYITGFNQDITERKRLEAERERITADLIQRNRDLEQFTYIVSHNLRGPVANIIGLCNLLESADPGTAEADKLKPALARSASILDGMIKDLNDILRVRTNVHSRLQAVPLVPLVEEITIGAGDLIKAENAEVTYDFGDLHHVTTVKSYLYSIFYNLIINAIKYRRPDASAAIHITGRAAGDKLELRFCDNGKGIHQKHFKDLFGLYKRFDTSVAGNGMGLFMVKMQVEGLGGNITVQSEPGAGTAFTITLPTAADMQE